MNNYKMSNFNNEEKRRKTWSRVNADGVRIETLQMQSKAAMKRTLRQNNADERRKVDPKILEKYKLGTGVVPNRLRGSKIMKHKIKAREKIFEEAEEETARAETLLTEETGQLEVEAGSFTSQITQKQIRGAVDITTASKSFDLRLTNFGPYRFRYTNNGRHVVLGGKMGHLAAFDWVTKKLRFETNVTESIHDVCYLNNEEKIAVAQKKWVYTYDNKGVETHCLKQLHNVINMEYLPYHCLLCTGNDKGILSWLDITLGQEILQFSSKKGPLKAMCQNPYNAVIYCGHNNGVVSMWTPNSNEYVASILCHANPITALTVDPTGKYFATASTDRLIKLWDARNMGEHVHAYKVGPGANNIAFSQKGLLAVAMNNVIEIFKGVMSGDGQPYMKHKEERTITGLQFCPYEDVLGASSYNGFCSLVIPGSGNANFDALEVNPYIHKTGRREAEIKNLLEKIPSSLITLDPASIGQVDTPTLKEQLEFKSKLLHVNVPKLNLEPRYRMKGKSGSAHKFKRKQKMNEELKRDYLKNIKEIAEKKREVKKKTYGTALDRFVQKTN